MIDDLLQDDESDIPLQTSAGEYVAPKGSLFDQKGDAGLIEL